VFLQEAQLLFRQLASQTYDVISDSGRSANRKRLEHILQDLP